MSAAPAFSHTAESKPTMDETVFQQLFESFATPQDMAMSDNTVFDEWLVHPSLPSPNTSEHSSPEIATPLDAFLRSPPFDNKDNICLENAGFGLDLDMSDILNSPLFDVASPDLSFQTSPIVDPVVVHHQQSQQSAPAPVSISTSTAQQVSHLFSDLGGLPAALAALAAANPPPGVPQTPVVVATSAVSPSPSPVFKSQTKRARDSIDEDLGQFSPCEAALKRQKNTDAARRSRLKKVMKMESLEIRVSDLEKINTSLLLRVAVLDSEKSNLQIKESSYESRIKVLEAQLAEAHKALAGRTI
ncbi:basic-leucine zipper transcription factor [Phycomyces blakesleeanus NRRL 1555(-)]|uniref:Basic-leucine zipper transcription factor n=1 Tax=Phycomyces blakesleeanus (strain ATCC 8743b / DSM 1359 / FGSC 10004 / NBRC 33097 / NRRL 1555) TaxID=763407 RepID=A0A162PUV8_PHYB8|nr:basic-leucine zipper transcription factor [Phycomyces blakesleeanus NRRL 1555(-)]OAD76217.1 basic-leucine zipper transcription factor [Phycomyces blakesleeanus NRRL 1555(-)]|eukprot:XP_018294257.1 basic-leucine zipper transcription factor [Phycomyces blakesleeanus NRRL 1555(-)]